MNPRIRGRLIEIRESLADLLSYPSLNEDIPVVYQTELMRALGTVMLVLDQSREIMHPPAYSSMMWCRRRTIQLGQDCSLKRLYVLYRDLLDPLYKSLQSKSGITPSRVERMRELVTRVRTLNVMDSAEVSALASRIEESIKDRAAITEQQFGKRLADLAAICRDDLAMLAVEVPKLGSAELEEDLKPAKLKAARKALALPDEPDIPRIRFEVPKLKTVEEVAAA